ncbi:nucleoside hydrolase [Pengzhenrongella frigida]|nr:nucleoside hydrolase [Cellulomonas sp. HLT2-17]
MSARLRVISDNDYSGDPDGLIQLAHLLLSPSVEVRAVIGSHLAPGDPFDTSGRTAESAGVAAEKVVALAGRTGVEVVVGAEDALVDAVTPHRSAGAAAIIAEALREDTDRPLYVVLGAGLTELASAYLLEPRIADRLTAVWIGGPEHPGLAEAPPGSVGPEYNLKIDLVAAQVVFDSPIPLWQVPRDAYRQTLVSFDELDEHLRPAAPLGAHLVDALDVVRRMCAGTAYDLGETYILGDSPLVLLTALLSSFEADSSSSRHVVLPAPRIADDGSYLPRPDGRPIRVYTHLDNRLMFTDLYAKLARHARTTPTGAATRTTPTTPTAAPAEEISR